MTEPVKVPRQHSAICHEQTLNERPGFLPSLFFLVVSKRKWKSVSKILRGSHSCLFFSHVVGCGFSL